MRTCSVLRRIPFGKMEKVVRGDGRLKRVIISSTPYYQFLASLLVDKLISTGSFQGSPTITTSNQKYSSGSPGWEETFANQFAAVSVSSQRRRWKRKGKTKSRSFCQHFVLRLFALPLVVILKKKMSLEGGTRQFAESTVRYWFFKINVKYLN